MPSRTTHVQLGKENEILYCTAAVTVKPWQRHVEATPPAANSYNVTLPNPQEVPGEIFYVRSNGNDTGTIVVKADGATIATLTADGDYTACFSTGWKWVELASVET